jgi:hypothetical protein
MGLAMLSDIEPRAPDPLRLFAGLQQLLAALYHAANLIPLNQLYNSIIELGIVFVV